MIQKFDTKKMIQISLLIALEIILSRFCSIAIPIAKIGFAFLPIVIIAMRYGPFYAGIAGAIADFIGAILFPTGAYFPGFTLTAFLAGAVYGAFLYNKPKGLLRVAIMVFAVSIFLHLGLNTVWLWMITGKAIMVIAPVRILQIAVMALMQVVCTVAVGNSIRFKKLIYSHT